MTREMNNMPTHRRGRTHYAPGAADNSHFSGFCSILFLVLLLLTPPFLLMGIENARHSRYLALSHAMDSNIHELSIHPHHNSIEGQLAHGTSSDIDTIATDEQVGISIPGALSLRRHTQYCQWSEHPSRKCQKCTRENKARDGSSRSETYDCNCITQYDYIKTWRDYRINSFLFDQPGAHYNPQRDPLPSATFLGDAIVTVDSHYHGHENQVRVHLDPDMLTGIRNQPYRRVDFVPAGRAPPPSFIGRFFARFFGPSNTRYESLQLLRDTQSAPAFTRDDFVYVGQGGYFFSPYENPSTSQRLFHYFVQYMEGSLFDWQLGDLMPSCTAGDIRFSYQVQDPSSISFLGEVTNARSSLLEMTPRSLLMNGSREDIGFVHAGYHSAENMITAEDTASRNTAIMFRALLFLWSIPTARLVGVGLGREIGESSLATQVMATFGMFSTLLSGSWFIIWNNDVGYRDTLLLFAVGGYFSFLALRSSVRRRNGRWYISVWCRIATWANAPPEWRVEDSYIPVPVEGPGSKRL
jgi:hypothetical protein